MMRFSTSRHGYVYRAHVDDQQRTTNCETHHEGRWVAAHPPDDWPWKEVEDEDEEVEA